MNRNVVKSTLASLLALCAAGSAQAGYTLFNYGSANPLDQEEWGTQKLESYDVAVLVKDPALTGKKITAITVPVVEDASMSDYSIWASTALQTKTLEEGGKVNDPNLFSQAVSVAGGKIELTLSEPYTITDEGVYVGYSFATAELTPAAKMPLVVTKGVWSQGALNVRTNRTYKNWKVIEKGLASCIQVRIEGDFPSNSLEVKGMSESHIVSGKPGELAVTVANTGGEAVTSLGYTLALDGQQPLTGNYTLPEALEPNFMGKVSVSIPVELPVSDNGRYAATLELSQVNGSANTAAVKSAEADLYVVPFLPVHRPVMEEYTGLWCSNCPRGLVALEIMSHLYPEEFIGLSIHYNDGMQTIPATDYANPIDGYPEAWVDRSIFTDPYEGDDYSGGFGIEKLWLAERARVAPAAVSVTAWESEDSSIINTRAEIEFAKLDPEATEGYNVAFVLLGDGMKNDLWLQANNYYGSKEFDDSPYYSFWEPFVTGGGNIKGLTYNDVVLGYDAILGNPLDTYSSPLQLGSVYRMTASFTPGEIRNWKDEAFINAEATFRVAALLIDRKSGAIVNAAKCSVTPASAVPGLDAETAQPVETLWYDLSGRRIDAPAHGLYIRQTRYTDGTLRATKVTLQ